VANEERNIGEGDGDEREGRIRLLEERHEARGRGDTLSRFERDIR
jgi:hypothetical protein